MVSKAQTKLVMSSFGTNNEGFAQVRRTPSEMTAISAPRRTTFTSLRNVS